MIKIKKNIYKSNKIIAMSLTALMILSILISMLAMITPVDARDEPIPGDLVFRYSRYDTRFGSIQGWFPGHVGIYIGNGNQLSGR
ncbi:MAG: hypothetical protein ACE5KE_06520 [Methanosarcinales archaeon]